MNCCKNIEEAEIIGSLIPLTIFQFLLWFPSVKWKIQEREGNEKKLFPQFGKGKGREGKKSSPIFREPESEALILGNGRERELPLTPDIWSIILAIPGTGRLFYINRKANSGNLFIWLHCRISKLCRTELTASYKVYIFLFFCVLMYANVFN